MREFYPLPKTTSRAVLTPEDGFRLENAPLPRPGSEDLLFRLLAAGLAAEDVDPDRHGGRVPPAQPVGEIAAVGNAVSGWNPLDRALVVPSPEDAGFGGLAGFFLVSSGRIREGYVHRLPLDLSAEDATLLPTAALAARALREAQVERIESLLVIGLGLAGQVAVRMARHRGLRTVFAADRSPTLRRRAEYSGATRVIRVPDVSLRDEITRETDGEGVEAAVVLSPDAALAHHALQVLAPGGSLVLGAPFSPSFLFALPGSRLQRRELRILGIGSFTPADLRAARQALHQGIVNADTLVSKRVSWNRLAEADLTPAYWEHGTHVVVEGPRDDEASAAD